MRMTTVERITLLFPVTKVCVLIRPSPHIVGLYMCTMFILYYGGAEMSTWCRVFGNISLYFVHLLPTKVYVVVDSTCVCG